MRKMWKALAVAAGLMGAALTSATAHAATLTIGYIPILAAAPLFVIDTEGWAKQAGVDLKLIKFEAGPAAIQALAAGQIDGIYAGVGPVLVARGSGVGVSVVANNSVEELALVARGGLADTAQQTPGAAAILKYAADTGRKVRIATQPAGSVPDTVLRYWIAKVAKLPADKIDVIPMGIEKTQQALLANVIDAAMIREPSITIIHNQDPKAVVLALGGQMFPNQPGTVIAFRDDVIAKEKDAIGTLVKLQIKAVDLVKSNPAQAAQDANQYIGKGLVDPATLQKALTSPSSKFTADPHAIVDATTKMQAFQKELGIAVSPVPTAQGFNFTFYDAAK